MNETKREFYLAKHEHDVLDSYLDNRDSLNLCEDCLMNDVYIEWNDKYLCQSCYEDYCEQAEHLADLKEDR